MKNGIVFYEKDYILDNTSGKEIIWKSAGMVTRTFHGAENNIKIADKKSGKLVAPAHLK